MQFYLIGGLIFALVVAVFAVQNATPVDIAFLGWRFRNISLVLVILGAAALGALVVFLPAFGRQLKLGLQLRELASRNRQMSEELRHLREDAASRPTRANASDRPNPRDDRTP